MTCIDVIDVHSITALHNVYYRPCIIFDTLVNGCIGLYTISSGKGAKQQRSYTMAKQKELPGLELVDIRVKVPRATRRKLNVLAAMNDTTVNALLNKAIDALIAESSEKE
jgi:hypothetical protein